MTFTGTLVYSVILNQSNIVVDAVVREVVLEVCVPQEAQQGLV